MRGLLPGAVIAALAWSGAGAHERMIPLACAPALPAYCANIHVGCGGRSWIATTAFVLEVNQRSGRWQSGARVTGGETRVDGYTFVFRPRNSRDWIRVEMDQGWGPYTYAERIYRNGQALMSRGSCWHAKAARYPALRQRALRGE